ncbi:response regulator [candidate division KSB1 bacterium]|nr:response regulator [candidate division KSB1 bacterium]RQW02804.1 MAG: hypothetical protein EH222_13245 [candidate division KSB1 bacterium]
MNCLLITKPDQNRTDLVSFLQRNGVEFDMTDDALLAIEKAHENRYDVVVMDAGDGLIDRTIRILKECNPAIRIIVRTDLNSRELEMLIRKESIFYYHVNSFGIQDVTSALGAALELEIGDQMLGRLHHLRDLEK